MEESGVNDLVNKWEQKQQRFNDLKILLLHPKVFFFFLGFIIFISFTLQEHKKGTQISTENNELIVLHKVEKVHVPQLQTAWNHRGMWFY